MERPGKIFHIGYVEELLSFSMDVKTDFVYLLFESKKKYVQKLHSDGELRQSEIIADPQMGTLIGLHFHAGQVD